MKKPQQYWLMRRRQKRRLGFYETVNPTPGDNLTADDGATLLTADDGSTTLIAN